MSCDPLGKDRELWGLPAAEPALRLPEQGADLRQSDQMGTILRSVNTEGGLLLQSERQTTFCVRRHDHSLERKNARISPQGAKHKRF